MRVIILVAVFFSSSNFGLGQEFYPQEGNLDIVGFYGIELFHGGGGVSFVDWNSDGFDDLTFATNNGQDVIFYENLGDGFQLVDPPFVSNTYEHKQILWIDYDNDGDKDLFISTYNGPNLLYQNDGNMNLTDVTATVGLPTDSQETFGITFGDVNMDGYLDFYQCNHGVNGSNGATNEYYVYDPSSSSYIDQTAMAGIGNGIKLSFCSAFFDFDRDNDLDLYIANDKISQENTLYMNLGNGVFVDVSIPSNSNIAICAMNTAIGDYNNDGFFDIYVTNSFSGPSTLLKNDGDNTFTDVSVSAGVTFDRNGWAANFLDYDNDMDLDLYVTSQDPGIDVPSAFYVNDGNGSFAEPLSLNGGLGGVDTVGAQVNAYGDFNNDGKLDVAVNRVFDVNFSLFSNHTENDNNYLAIKLQGSQANRDAYGAIMEVWIDGSSWSYATHSTHAYLAQNSDRQIISIGTHTSIDSLQIIWPSNTGMETIMGSDFLINGVNNITEGSGIVSKYTTKLCQTTQDVSISPIPSQTYGASQTIDSGSLVLSDSEVVFAAEQEITLDINFEVEVGADFEAEINNCINN